MSSLYNFAKSALSGSAHGIKKAAPSQRTYRVISRNEFMAQHPELENNLTKVSLNRAVLRGYTRDTEIHGSTPFHDDENAIDPVPVNESQRTVGVSASTKKKYPLFVPNSEVYTYYAQPIKTQNGVTEKSTTLPGIRYFGGKVQLDKDTAPFEVLVFETDQSFTGDDQCGTVVTGWKDDELRNYWTKLRSSTPKRASHPSVPPDAYLSIRGTCEKVLGHLLVSPPPLVYLSHFAEMERAMLDGDAVHSGRSME